MRREGSLLVRMGSATGWGGLPPGEDGEGSLGDGNVLHKLIMNGSRGRAARSGGSSKKRDFMFAGCVFVFYCSY